MQPTHDTASDSGFVAYVMQRFPSLRTTFIRRDIEALRRYGVPLRLVSIRPVDLQDITDESEAVAYQQETTYLSTWPVDLESLVANGWAFLRHPWMTLRSWGWAFGDAGGRGFSRRVRLWLQIWRGPVLARRLRRLGGCRHIHAQFADGAATTALVASRLLGIGFSFTSHTSYDSPLLGQKLRHAKFVASISEYDRRRLMERGGEAVSGRIHVIHCGIPIKDWTFVEPRDVVSPLRILSVGALIEKKGHDSLIRACALLKKQGMPFECRIVGAGPLEAELSALVAQFGLHSVVQLVGPQPQERIRAELANADVFVLASRTTADGDTDGIPVSLMEAMALGIGVVSTKVAGIPELVKDEVTGFLAEEGDVPALANSILRAAQDGFERRQRVLAARYVIEQHFNADVESGKLATLLTRSALTATAGAWSASPSQDRCGAP